MRSRAIIDLVRYASSCGISRLFGIIAVTEKRNRTGGDNRHPSLRAAPMRGADIRGTAETSARSASETRVLSDKDRYSYKLVLSNPLRYARKTYRLPCATSPSLGSLANDRKALHCRGAAKRAAAGVRTRVDRRQVPLARF